MRRIFDRDAGLLAAIVYMYVPFHLLEIFVRSAYAEFVALAMVPLDAAMDTVRQAEGTEA